MMDGRETRFDSLEHSALVRALTHGDCYPAAIALHEVLEWPIAGFLVDWKERAWLPHLVHAFLLAPDGQAFDASGFRTVQEIADRFLGEVREGEVRNPRICEYGDGDTFRKALRPLFVGAAPDECHRYFDPTFDPDQPTKYDAYLDQVVPRIREAIVDKLELVQHAEATISACSHGL